MRHKLQLETTAYGHWGECSCGWSIGPTTKGEVRKGHQAHVAQREAEHSDMVFGWDSVDDEL